MYLLPTDGSSEARRAEDVIERFFDPETDTIQVLVVIEEEPNPLASPDRKADYETNLIEQAESIANSSAKRLQDEGFTVETEIIHGRAGPTICDQAEKLGADGIVIGRRGLGAAGELLLGSVSHHVVHHATCPVTVVPPASSSD